MILLDAIAQVLISASQPLHLEEITRRVLDSGLWASSGKTPVATVKARLYSNIKQKGAASAFIRVAPQTFALRQHAAPAAPVTDSASVPPVVQPADQATAALSFTDCAQKVLRRFADQQPMHYKVITNLALTHGWLVTQSKTPHATMYAQIIADIKRQQRFAESPRFIQHKTGFISLGEWATQDFPVLPEPVRQYQQQVRQRWLNQLCTMPLDEFATLVSELLAETGFIDIDIIRQSRDGDNNGNDAGNDADVALRGTLVVADAVQISMLVLVKRCQPGGKVSAVLVQQVRDRLAMHERGLIMTTGAFSEETLAQASHGARPPVALIDGEQLVSLLMQHNIGVQRCAVTLFTMP